MANVSDRRLFLAAYCSRTRRPCPEHRALLCSFDRTDAVCEAYVDPALGPHRLPRPGTPSVFGVEDASRARVTLETWLARKRKRGYAPRSEPARPALLSHESASTQNFRCYEG